MTISENLSNFLISFSRVEVEGALNCDCEICGKLRLHWERRRVLQRSITESSIVSGIVRMMSPSKQMEAQIRIAFEQLGIKSLGELRGKIIELGMMKNIGKATMNVILDYIALVDRYGEDYVMGDSRHGESHPSASDLEIEDDIDDAEGKNDTETRIAKGRLPAASNIEVTTSDLDINQA